MKLVELLAKEVAEWQEGAYAYAQDGNRKTYAWTGIPEFDGEDWLIAENAHIHHGENTVLYPPLADDYKTSAVTKAQWQAERDRQKGGEWKRHRGGVSKLNPGQVVEVKLRCGDIQQGISGEFIWMHDACDVAANIMQYRVISQPQAEEVVVNNVYAVDNTDHGPTEVQWTEAKTDQVDGPIKWRDTVNELDAYIEEFTRERDELINRLALEGFALIPAMDPVMGVADVDMSDWRNWKAGDVVECTESDFENVYTVGNYYKVAKVTSEYARVQDDCGPESYCHINDVHCATLGFILRP